jgi:hypothetical protein
LNNNFINSNNALEMEDANFWAKTYSRAIDPADNPLEPVSDILYPIIDQVDAIDLHDLKTLTSTQYQTVGNLATTVYWRDFFRDVLSVESNVLHIVVVNDCNPSFTYQIRYVLFPSPRTVFYPQTRYWIRPFICSCTPLNAYDFYRSLCSLSWLPIAEVTSQSTLDMAIFMNRALILCADRLR